MAESTCVRCGWNSFEVVYLKMIIRTAEIHQEAKRRVIQCAKCGGVIGLFDVATQNDVSNLESEIKKIR
jgi:ribosomal protein L37E